MIKLSNRLQACCSLVNEGARLADIGCDHGYVPVYLVKKGVIQGAVASDINEGPLNSCKKLVLEAGLESKIKCVLSNGLEEISADDIDDILIAGMGGELIAEILGNCPYVREKHIVLNPMTHPEVVRKWLFDNGFTINDDIIIKEGRHYYNILDAEYTGDFVEKSEKDYFLGKIDDFSNKEYFSHLMNYLINKEKGGVDYSEVIAALRVIVNDNG